MIREVPGRAPRIHPDTWIDPSAQVIGSITGFVRRVDGKPEAVSGVCTHQGCRLWFDAPDDTLRCPCHTTSFSPTGQVLTHQLPIAPKPLPALMVREVNGVIEVLAPPRRDQPA